MQLKLKNNGSNTNFINWLKGFKDIDSTLLVEIDLTEAKFVAKGFPESRAIVKYSEISFENAGYSISELLDDEGRSGLTTKLKLGQKYANEFTGDNRIKYGVYAFLGKLIDVMSMYNNVEHSLCFTFGNLKHVKYVQAPTAMEQWQVDKLSIVSKSLTYTVSGSQLAEFFRFLSDDLMLNTICAVNDAIEFKVSADTLANLNKISLLNTSDKSRAIIKLYPKKEGDVYALYAYDEADKYYDYLLGYAPDTVKDIADDTAICVLRENLINATKGMSDELGIFISQADGSRILVTTQTSKVVISAYQNR